MARFSHWLPWELDQSLILRFGTSYTELFGTRHPQKFGQVGYWRFVSVSSTNGLVVHVGSLLVKSE